MAAAEAEGRGGEPATPAPAPDGSQPVEDRRLLRSRYLAVKSLINLISDEKDDMASADSVKFRSIFTQVEDLHKLVQRPREQISDAEALLDIATSLVTSVRSQSALGITPSDFVAGLLKKFGKQGGTDDEGASLSWGGVGLAASHVFMAVPGCCTMVGPMNTEVKPWRVQTSRKRTARPRGSACPEQKEKEAQILPSLLVDQIEIMHLHVMVLLLQPMLKCKRPSCFNCSVHAATSHAAGRTAAHAVTSRAASQRAAHAVKSRAVGQTEVRAAIYHAASRAAHAANQIAHAVVQTAALAANETAAGSRSLHAGNQTAHAVVQTLAHAAIHHVANQTAAASRSLHDANPSAAAAAF